MVSDSLRVETVAAPVRQQVLGKLRQAIIDGKFPPGSRLVERELCDLTGVSRTSVREAIRQLESEGLVEIAPNRGPVVARFRAEDARAIFEFRSMAECLAVELFTNRATEEERASLVRELEYVVEACEMQDIREILRTKRVFFGLLLKGARNPVLADVLEGLYDRISILRVTTLSRPGRTTETSIELRSMVDAIVRRDAAAAVEACREHVVQAAKIASAALENQADEDGIASSS